MKSKRRVKCCCLVSCVNDAFLLCFSLQRILGVPSFHEVLDHRCINPQNIIHNMTKVNKHGVVTLEDKTSRLINCQQIMLSLICCNKQLVFPVYTFFL